MEDGSYNSWIANVPIKLGKCPNYMPRQYNIQQCHYNINMIGKCSGFARLKDIINQIKYDRYKKRKPIILRLELSGSIMQGTAFNVADQVRNSSITYAGTHIDSIKELDLNKILKT